MSSVAPELGDRLPMIRVRVLIAHEPRVYRETLSSALTILRPEAEVWAIDPVDLDVSVAAIQPHLVLCSRLTATVESILAWMVLYPEGANRVEIGVAGERETADDITLGGLLAVVDWARYLAQMSQSYFAHPWDGNFGLAR